MDGVKDSSVSDGDGEYFSDMAGERARGLTLDLFQERVVGLP